MFDYNISVSRRIMSNPDEIWKKISTPGILNRYHPFCKDNPVQVWNGKQSIDKIIYENDLVYKREFKQWFEGLGYDLTIIKGKRELADVFWRIREVDNKSYELQITLKLKLDQVLPRIPHFFRWIPYFVIIRWQMKSYLTHVLKGFDFYIKNDLEVKPNQFGRHRIYSAKTNDY